MKTEIVEKPANERLFYQGQFKELFNQIDALDPEEMMVIHLEPDDNIYSIRGAINHYYPDKSVVVKKITESKYGLFIDKHSVNDLRNDDADSNTTNSEEE